MTLGQTRSIVETRMAVGGKSIMEHNEILGVDAALKVSFFRIVKPINVDTVHIEFSFPL